MFNFTEEDLLLEDWKEKSVNNIMPTVEMMKEWFPMFNDEFFGGELPMCKLVIEPLGPHTWGRFSASSRRYYKTNRKWVDRFNPSNCKISISSNFSAPLSKIQNTMIHEMIHYWVHMHYNYHPTRSHGQEFLAKAAAIKRQSDSKWNITPTSDCGEATLTDTAIKKYAKNAGLPAIIFEFPVPDKWGKTHLCLTNEKHLYDAYILCKGYNKEPRFFNVLIENPRFFTDSKALRNRNVCHYICSGDNVDECFEKIDGLYTVLSREEFTTDLSNEQEETYIIEYFIGGHSRSYEDVYYYSKTDTLKFIDKLKKDYCNSDRIIKVYKAIGGNDLYKAEFSIKGKISHCLVGKTSSREIALDRLKTRYDVELGEEID